MIPSVNNLRDLLNQVNYRKWNFDCGVLGEGYFLRVRFEAGGEQLGRKWYISRHAMPAEVLQTALLAVLTATEHEVREDFLFGGRAIFHPHHPLPVLFDAALQREHRLDAATPEVHDKIGGENPPTPTHLPPDPPPAPPPPPSRERRRDRCLFPWCGVDRLCIDCAQEDAA